MSKPIESNKTKDISGIVMVIMILIAVGFIGFLMFSNSQNNSETSANSIITADGIQIVEMTAGFSDYSPAVVNAKAGIPTVLRIKSNNNLGCGNAFRIPSLNISRSLPINGTTDIELGTIASGTTLDAMCSMGMNRMQIKFV